MRTEYYDIEIKPTDRFFFGGEIIFGQEGDEQRRRSYLVKSRILPQQTSLLGMLRFEILKSAGKLAPYAGSADRDIAEKLVGRTGFTLPSSASQDFGAIQAISPVLLSDGRYLWSPRPLDDGSGIKGNFRWRRTKQNYWLLENYAPKHSLELAFGYDDNNRKKLDDLFFSQSVTGNRISNRHYRGGALAGLSDEGLFRQTFRQNVTGYYQRVAAATQSESQKDKLPEPSEFSFAFRVALDADLLSKQHPAGKDVTALLNGFGKVTLGGERSQFILKATRVDYVAESVTTPEPTTMESFLPTVQYFKNIRMEDGCRRIVFQSDVWLPKAVAERKDYFLLANPRSFRFLASKLTIDSQAHHFNRRMDSASYTLLERGGVIIVSDTATANEIVSQINSHEPYRQIGYNYCTHVK